MKEKGIEICGKGSHDTYIRTLTYVLNMYFVNALFNLELFIPKIMQSSFFTTRHAFVHMCKCECICMYICMYVHTPSAGKS